MVFSCLPSTASIAILGVLDYKNVLAFHNNLLEIVE